MRTSRSSDDSSDDASDLIETLELIAKNLPNIAEPMRKSIRMIKERDYWRTRWERLLAAVEIADNPKKP
jgi:hypothetical protein